MLLTILKSKIHKATITEANLNYTGSIGIDTHLLEASNILPYEKVLIVNNNNGARFETYTIPENKKGYICLNGAAARLGQVGDHIIIMAFVQLTSEEYKKFKSQVLYINEDNEITKVANE